MKRVSLLILASLLGLTACDDSSPTAADPSPADVTGSWIGTGTDSAAVRAIGFLFAQNGADVVGPALVSISGARCEGAVVGTVAGTTLTFSVVVNAGDCEAPSASCTLSMTGTAMVEGQTMTGSYTGDSSCAGSLRDGVLALTRG